MPLRLTAVSLLSLSLLAACGGGPAPSTGPQADFGHFSALKPGVQDTVRTTLRVNIVLVGYRPTPPGSVATARQVSTADFAGILPKTYDAIARVPSAYGTTERTGNAFDYAYHYVYADGAFEDDFFSFLASQGRPQSLTIGSALYNCQSAGVQPVAPLDPSTLRVGYTCPAPAANIAREVTGNLEIDAAATENWLADHAGRLGVNPGEYTVFLVNWYDRPDFQFHSYTRADFVASDLGGVTDAARVGKLNSRRVNAWGGSTRENAPAQRVWFYDLSANPDYWTAGGNVTMPDLNGDGVEDSRMPPVWEYGTRKASLGYGRKVGPDLARVVRYVALNLLFTPSPLYRAALTPPRQPEEIELDLNVVQGAGAPDPALLLRPQVVQDRVSVLHPFTRFSNTVRQRPLEGELAEAYRCALPAHAEDPSCSPEYVSFFGEPLFRLGVNELRARYLGVPASRYLLPAYAFNDAEEHPLVFSGYAYDDDQTGTQSFAYVFLTPPTVTAGIGLTDLLTHEIGHHLSLSHPHDGYDSESDTSYGPDGPFYFAWSGDHSASVMSYLGLHATFGQFNLDGQYRQLTSAYLNNTNAILELARRAGKAGEVTGAAQGADAQFVQAKARYDALSYLEAAQLAHAGYRAVLNAALSAGVDVQPYRWYENLSGLSTPRRKPRVADTFLPLPGAVIFPEETPEGRRKRLAP